MALERSAQRLGADFDRIRAERDQLEARLAAEEEPAVCASPTLATGDANLTPFFTVDYPCGWHVLWEPLRRTAEKGREGLLVDSLFLGRLPINRTPGGGPLTDVELADWYDDPDNDTDQLPMLEEWLAEERATLSSIESERTFETADGLPATQIRGTIDSFGKPFPVIVYVWEYEDRINRDRHIVRVFSLDPPSEVREALHALVTSFEVLEP